MEAKSLLSFVLSKLLQAGEHDRQEKHMDANKPKTSTAERVMFSHDEFTRDPAAVMLAARERGRVVVTDSAGRPSLAISRQSDEISAG